MSSITPETVISRKKDGLLVSELGNEIVMMDVENGNYIGLNETGRVIWEMIEAPVKVDDLVQLLVARYDISYEACFKDTLECLNKMDEQKIIMHSI